jgi:hypothetical protein
MSNKSHAQRDEPMSGSDDFKPLFNLVYCSRASEDMDDAAVDRIVALARRNNPAHGITGLLVFGSGLFFQWLEGPRESVLQLMANLRTDPRHQDVVQLSQSEELRDRLFPDWDMELVTADHIREVLLDARDNATDEQNAEALAVMLQHLESGELSTLGAA